MDYSLNIVASVKGQACLDATLKTIGQIRSLARDIKPLDLLSPGSGKAGDEIRKAKTELDKLARAATNNEATFSKTFGGARSQAQAFATALDNVGLKLNLPFNKQAAEVKNYANALAQAEAQAEKLGKKTGGATNLAGANRSVSPHLDEKDNIYLKNIKSLDHSPKEKKKSKSPMHNRDEQPERGASEE